MFFFIFQFSVEDRYTDWGHSQQFNIYLQKYRLLVIYPWFTSYNNRVFTWKTTIIINGNIYTYIVSNIYSGKGSLCLTFYLTYASDNFQFCFVRSILYKETLRYRKNEVLELGLVSKTKNMVIHTPNYHSVFFSMTDP